MRGAVLPYGELEGARSSLELLFRTVCMPKDKRNENNRVVFSTNPNYKPESDSSGNEETLSASQQTLYVSLERLKGGKVATIVDSFKGKEADLENLGKQLKSKCGVGGTVKDGIILLQGEHRDKVMAYLNTLGYKTKRKGG
jgi:translation initiation factor 1